MQATVQGVIDFSQADFGDPRWWRRVRLLLDGLEKQNEREQLDRVHRHNTALFGAMLESEGFEKVQQQSVALIDLIDATYFAGVTAEKEAQKHKIIRQRIDSWEQRHGKLDDPETKKKIENTARALTEMYYEALEENAQGGIMAPPQPKEQPEPYRFT